MHKPEPLKTEDALNAREFCLSVIKEVYGLDYNPEWHFDLDSLGTSTDLYVKNNRGKFYIIKSGKEIVATIGLRPLSTKPAIAKRFRTRYSNIKTVGSIWRAYVKKDLRGQGLGSKLVQLIERDANKLGYKLVYLHSSADQSNAVKFWQKMGYTAFATDDNNERTIHFDKQLVTN